MLPSCFVPTNGCPSHFMQLQKILAHPISLLSSSWIHLWRHLHILLSSLSPLPVVHSYQADLQENSPSALLLHTSVIMAHSLPSFRSLPRDTSTKRLSLTFLSALESSTLIVTLTLAQFYSLSYRFTIDIIYLHIVHILSASFLI